MTDMDLKEFKCTAVSLLTSSKGSLSIEQFRKDFLAIVGTNIPFKLLGFNSDIELLQSVTDILIVSI